MIVKKCCCNFVTSQEALTLLVARERLPKLEEELLSRKTVALVAFLTCRLCAERTGDQED